jgi:ERCC4-type nuclease
LRTRRQADAIQSCKISSGVTLFELLLLFIIFKYNDKFQIHLKHSFYYYKMKITVDYREKQLIIALNALNRDNDYHFEIVIVVLPIGDIIISDKEKDLLIIERKTITDLAASVRDGRYAEQSYRLNEHPLHNHNIVYLIEGSISAITYSSKFTKINIGTIRTCMFSLNYFKGFTVVRSNSIIESAEYILRSADKIKREMGKKLGYYDTKNLHEKKGYNTVVKKEKKEYITPENIGEIILSQIPSVSEKTAHAIISRFLSLIHLIDMLRVNDNCLDDITFETTGGRQRRISKRSIENIKKYLLFQKENIIKAET